MGTSAPQALAPTDALQSIKHKMATSIHETTVTVSYDLAASVQTTVSEPFVGAS